MHERFVIGEKESRQQWDLGRTSRATKIDRPTNIHKFYA